MTEEPDEIFDDLHYHDPALNKLKANNFIRKGGVMEEPINIDQYWIYIGSLVVDGKKGKGKEKRWRDDEGKIYRRVLTFEEDK